MGRRTRRIGAAAALAALCATSVASAGEAGKAIGVEDDFFSPAETTVEVDSGTVTWIWDLDASTGGTTENPHDVVSEDGLFSSKLKNAGSFGLDPSAGSYSFFCTIHAGMSGRLRVRMRAEDVTAPLNRFLVTWAPNRGETGDRYDVRYAVGKGRWRRWLEDVKNGSADFGRANKPVDVEPNTRYRFQARSQQGSREKKRSGWSPKLAFRT